MLQNKGAKMTDKERIQELENALFRMAIVCKNKGSILEIDFDDLELETLEDSKDLITDEYFKSVVTEIYKEAKKKAL